MHTNQQMNMIGGSVYSIDEVVTMLTYSSQIMV